jgi:dihydrofolate reductase
MTVTLIVAASENDVIGKAGALPWHLPDDLRRFKSVTSGHTVIMGRITHESVLRRLGRPLPGRNSVVVSHRPGASFDDVTWAESVESAVSLALRIESLHANEQVFVAGGVSVYEQVLSKVDRVLLTRVHNFIEGDKQLPANWLAGFRLVSCDRRTDTASTLSYSFLEYTRKA